MSKKTKQKLAANRVRSNTASQGTANSIINGLRAIVPKGTMKALGASVGGRLGPLGATAGGFAGDLIARLTGVGEYKVQSNSLVTGNAIPTFYNSGDGMEICHREFITDVSGSDPFVLNSLIINPGLASTFPWLSQVAKNFEQYSMLGLVFEYRPTSGSVATTTAALGVVMYATNYDVLDAPFNSKQEMDAYEYSSSTVPFDKMLHAVECDHERNPLARLYIRTDPAPPGADARFHDLGRFQYATKGMQSAYVVGELWVTYHVRLLKPKIAVPALVLPPPPPPYVPRINPYEYYHVFRSSPDLTSSTSNPLGGSGMVTNDALSGLASIFVDSIDTGAPEQFVIHFPDPAPYLLPHAMNRAIIRLTIQWRGQSSNPYAGQGLGSVGAVGSFTNVNTMYHNSEDDQRVSNGESELLFSLTRTFALHSGSDLTATYGMDPDLSSGDLDIFVNYIGRYNV